MLTVIDICYLELKLLIESVRNRCHLLYELEFKIVPFLWPRIYQHLEQKSCDNESTISSRREIS